MFSQHPSNPSFTVIYKKCGFAMTEQYLQTQATNFTQKLNCQCSIHGLTPLAFTIKSRSGLYHIVIFEDNHFILVNCDHRVTGFFWWLLQKNIPCCMLEWGKLLLKKTVIGTNFTVHQATPTKWFLYVTNHVTVLKQSKKSEQIWSNM